MRVADKILKSSIKITVVTLTTASCVYFNALYNANRLFDRGRDEIEAGNVSSGASLLGQSIEKAERILANNPDSRWADDALRLVVRSHLLREEWPEAAEAGRRLLSMARSAEDSAEAAGYLGMAELELGNVDRAETLLDSALSSRAAEDRRPQLLYDRGRARAALGRHEEASVDLRRASDLRPSWVQPRLVRLALLIESGEVGEAAREFRLIASARHPSTVEERIVRAAREAAGLDAASGRQILDGIESSQLRTAPRAELLELRGRLALSLGDTAASRTDFSRAIDAAPESRAAARSHLGLVQVEMAGLAEVGDLARVRALLTRASTSPVAVSVPEIRALLDDVRRIEFWLTTQGLGYLAAAEVARDRLGAPALARHLFLQYARDNPDALWAPKAILAALALTGIDSNGPGESEEARELRQRLVEDYRDSAYVEVLIGGDDSPYTYEELETGLSRQLDRLRVLADQELRGRRAGPGRGQ